MIRVALFLLLSALPTSAFAVIRVAVAPIRGDAKYPLVMAGLRQVLIADLTQSGQATIIETDISGDQLTATNLPDLSSQINADIVLLTYFNEGQPDFVVSIRAYDVATGYNLGSADVVGRYKDVRIVQDRLFNSALDLLRTPVPAAQKSQITRSHTEAVGAVAALGEADVAVREKRYSDAFQGFARSRAIDPQFRSPTYQMEKMGPGLISKIGDPTNAARAYAFMGDAKRAITEFDLILQKNPKDANALVGKADSLMQVGKVTDAIPIYNAALGLDPKNATAAVGLARAYQSIGRAGESVTYFEKARELGTTDPEIYESLGSFYAGKGKSKQAAEAYQVAGQLAERTTNFQKAQKYYSKVTEIVPSVTNFEKQASLYIAQGDYQLAILVLTKALFAEPNRDSIFATLGYAYYMSQQPGEAIKKLQRAYELNNDNYEANLYLGIILLAERESRTKAVKHLEAAARLRPSERIAQTQLAQAYLLENKVGAAIDVLENLVKTFPRDPKAHKDLGDAYYRAEDFPHAVIAYNRAIELNRDYREAYEAVARAYAKLGKRDEALAAIQRVYAIDATNNAFLKGVDNGLLESLTNGELINLARSFRKVVTTNSGDIPVNQITVVRVDRGHEWRERLRPYFEIYRINTSLIQRDFEMALFAQYRVMPVNQTKNISSGTIALSDFELTSYMSNISSQNALDGVAGFEVVDVQHRGQVALVTVGSLFFTRGDGEIFRNNSAQIAYSASDILTFNPIAPIAYLLALALLFGPFTYITVYRSAKRGKGNLRVIINYDPKLESFLTLKLSKKQEKERDPRLVIVRDKKKYEKRKYRDLLRRQKGEWVRKMVGKVTLFEKVPARSYFCYLYGTIEDAAISKATIGNYYMVQRIEVEKGQTKELVFQLEKEECFVTIFVRKGEEDVPGAEIRVDKDPDIKYSRGAQGAFVYLSRGKHIIRVTHEGRTVEHPLEVRDLEDKMINIDLLTVEEAEEAALGGKNLTEVAQEFESQGRLQDAAQLYEKAGATDRAGEARAQAALAEGNLDVAAEEFVRSREFLKAADLYRQLGNTEKMNYLYGVHSFQAGEYQKALEYLEPTNNFALLVKVYEKLGEKKKMQFAMGKVFESKGQKIEAAQAFIQGEAYVQAAELYETLGDFSKAAMLHAKDGNYSLAAELFVQAGDLKKAAMAYEKGGLLDQAAEFYKQLGETEKVIEILVRDERYVDAAILYRDQGLIDEAIALCQKVPSYHSSFHQSQLLLGQMFSNKGMDDLAIKTFQEVQTAMPDLMDSESLYTFGILLERNSEFEKALAVFEELLKKDFHFKDVSLKINELKTKVSGQKAKAKSVKVNETVAAGTPLQPSRYEIMEEVGRGAMGIVYKAKDKTLGRIVAFKTLPHTLKDDPQALESLLKEAQTVAKLNHPNIVTVYDIGQEEGNYFIAMEFIQGKTLQQVLKQVGKVNFQNFGNVATPLCEVVAYAHEQRVIHRDIKPSNIILLPSRTVKLMDFGLAKVLQDMSIDKTMLRGTPLYMSPEQVLGKDIDHRTDLYSLGVLFYEMLSGKPPFFQGDIMYAHLHTPPPPLAGMVQGVPAKIVDMIMSCLEKDKTKRPSSAKDIAAAFTATA